MHRVHCPLLGTLYTLSLAIIACTVSPLRQWSFLLQVDPSRTRVVEASRVASAVSAAWDTFASPSASNEAAKLSAIQACIPLYPPGASFDTLLICVTFLPAERFAVATFHRAPPVQRGVLGSRHPLFGSAARQAGHLHFFFSELAPGMGLPQRFA